MPNKLVSSSNTLGEDMPKMMSLSEWLTEDGKISGVVIGRDTAIRWLRAGYLGGKIFYRCTKCRKKYAVADYFKDRCPNCGSKEKTRRGVWLVSTPPGERVSTPPPAGRRWR